MKKLKFILLILMSFSLLTACSSNNTEEDISIQATHRFSGEVTSILGNEVTAEGITINLKDMEERRANFENQEKQVDGENIDREALREEMGNRQGNGLSIETEEAVFTIPIGIEIVEATVDDEGNMVEEDASLSDIKAGSTITILYNETIDNIVQISIVDTANMTPGMGGMGGMMGGMGGKGGGR